MSNPLGKTRQILEGERLQNLVSPARSNLRGQESPNSSQLAPLTTPQVIRSMQSIVLQFPIKQVADQAGATPRAIENMRNGECAMNLRNFFNLCRANPRIRAMAAPLMGLEETDPDFVQGLSLLMNSLSRNGAGTSADPDENNSAGDDDVATGDLFGGRMH